jgi:predicted nucleic-acid-binding protein
MCDIFEGTHVARVSASIIDDDRFAVGHHPAGDAAFERYGNARVVFSSMSVEA